MTTGKNKEQFEKWFRLNFHWTIEDAGDGTYFNALPFEMQIGVYLAYYDSVGVVVEENKSPTICYWYFMINDSANEYDDNNNFKSRNEALREAFKKADELINQNYGKE